MRRLRTVEPILLIGFVILHLVAGELRGSEIPQKSRQPPRPIVLPPDMAEMLPPGYVRSITLMYLARDLSKSRANELEAALRKTPDNTDDRVTMIGYYSWNGQTVADRLRLRAHVLWFVENHPEHPAAGEPNLRDLPDDPEGNAQILALWNKNLESRGNDLDVLKNAEKFFFGEDPPEADRILHLLSQREPNNRQWPKELAKLYAIFGIPGYPAGDSRGKASEAYKRVLELTKDPAAREALAGDMAESAFKFGDFAAADQFARIDLQGSDRAAVQRANTILGRVALRSGDLGRAKQYLLDSGRPAAPYISAFGPTMVLAKELLEKGDREAVLQYLTDCLLLWPRGDSLLHGWISDINGGRIPNFGNLAF